MKQIWQRVTLVLLFTSVALAPRWNGTKAELTCNQHSLKPDAEFRDMTACLAGTGLRPEWTYCSCSLKSIRLPYYLYFNWLVPAAIVAVAFWLPTSGWRRQSLRLLMASAAGGLVYLIRSWLNTPSLWNGPQLFLAAWLLVVLIGFVDERPGTIDNRPDRQTYVTGIRRGLLILAMLTIAPALVAGVLTMLALAVKLNAIANVAFGFVLIWIYLVLPQLASVPQIAEDHANWIITVAVWVVVGLLVGRLTIRYSRAKTFAIALGSAVLIVAVTHLALRAFGYDVIAEGP